MKNILPEMKEKTGNIQISRWINSTTAKNVFFFSGGILLFIGGIIVYGIIINLREIPLNEAMHNKGITKFNNPLIIIDKKYYRLNLYEDTLLVKSYKANFGMNVKTRKSLKNDNATPVGEYKICYIISNYKYHKFLQINYPNLDDAVEGLRKNIITQEEFDRIKSAYTKNICPEPGTELGGNVGIHGIGEYDFFFRNLPFNYNWTDGSVALSNENIDELLTVIKKGTKVVIK